MTVAHHLRVRLIGQLRCLVDGTEIELNRVQVRRALVILAAAGGRMVGADALVEHLWPSDQPGNPGAAASVVLSRLRGSLGPCADRLQTRSGSRSLAVDSTDVDDLRRAVTDARAEPERAVEILDPLRELLVEEVAPEILESPLMIDTAHAIDEVVWEARSLLVGAMTRTGDHAGVVDLALPWARGWPHRERVVASVARSLGALGSRTAALELVATTRTALRDDFGLTLHAEVAAVERELLAETVELPAVEMELVRSDSRTDPRPVGRDGVLAELLGSGGSSLLVGEPGIGKSTVMTAVADALRTRGETVVTVHGSLGYRSPLEAVSRLLRALLAEVDERPSCGGDIAARLGLEDVVTVVDDGQRSTRETLVRESAALLADLVARTSASVLVDDAHSLNGICRDVMGALHRQSAGRMVIGTRQDDAVESVFDGAVIHRLAALSVDDVQALMQRDVPSIADRSRSEQIFARSGGNPLFTSLLIEMLAEGEGTEDSLATSVLLAVQHRLVDLPRRTRRALETASVLGTRFGVTTWNALGLGAVDVFDDAVQAHLVSVEGGEVRFRHAIVQAAVYELVPPGHRIDMHDEIGTALEDAGSPASAWAPHYLVAATLDPSRAVRAAVSAADDHVRDYAWDAAGRFFDEALRVVDVEHLPLDRWVVRATLGRGAVMRLTGQRGSDEVLQQAAHLARRLGDDTLFADAVAELCSHGDTLLVGAVHDDARRLLDDALELDLAPATRVRLCAAAATLLSLSSQQTRASELYRDALVTARAIGDETLERDVLMNVHVGLSHPADFDERIELVDRLADLAGADLEVQWEVAFLRAMHGLASADPGPVGPSVELMHTLTPRLLGRSRRFGLAFTDLSVALAQGRVDDADALLDVVLAEGLQQYSESWVTSVYASLLVAVRNAQGRLGELAALGEGLIEATPDFVTWRVLVAACALDNGDVEAARRHWDVARRDDLGGVIEDTTWTTVMSLAARVAVGLGDQESAAVIRPRLSPYSGRMMWSGVGIYDPVDESLALLADSEGDTDAAQHHRQIAAAMVERLRSI